MSVRILADNYAKLGVLSGILSQRFEVSPELLGKTARHKDATHGLVVNADLRVVENISALKELSDEILRVPKRIFIVDQRTRLAFVQAYALGATHVLVNPVNPTQLLAKLVDVDVVTPTAPELPSGGEGVAAAGAASIASMFSAAVRGAPVNVPEARMAGTRIADCVAELGMSEWLNIVRRHHEGTYQHCLLVTGVAVDFGLSLGMGRADIDRLHMAAMFHDIGKAKIPLTILDKPGKLDSNERLLIETHPVVGYDALKGNVDISGEVLDAVRHHHEYLDGSGYPDGLCAASISDIVRILTISDIFAALIEQRPYKPTMTRGAAYDILLSMQGKLETPLVEAFRSVAISR